MLTEFDAMHSTLLSVSKTSNSVILDFENAFVIIKKDSVKTILKSDLPEGMSFTAEKIL
jgi:hypothetical protein